LILVDMMKSFGIDGKEFEGALDKIGLNLNANAIPNDTLPPFRPSGVRLGTPAITTRGLVEGDMARLAEWMKLALENRKDEGALEGLRLEVQEFSRKFPLPSDR
jgi:glycine hydroxymethyltransferase